MGRERHQVTRSRLRVLEVPDLRSVQERRRLQHRLDHQLYGRRAVERGTHVHEERLVGALLFTQQRATKRARAEVRDERAHAGRVVEVRLARPQTRERVRVLYRALRELLSRALVLEDPLVSDVVLVDRVRKTMPGHLGQEAVGDRAAAAEERVDRARVLRVAQPPDARRVQRHNVFHRSLHGFGRPVSRGIADQPLASAEERQDEPPALKHRAARGGSRLQGRRSRRPRVRSARWGRPSPERSRRADLRRRSRVYRGCPRAGSNSGRS